jgi:hypothetical protein
VIDAEWTKRDSTAGGEEAKRRKGEKKKQDGISPRAEYLKKSMTGKRNQKWR